MYRARHLLCLAKAKHELSGVLLLLLCCYIFVLIGGDVEDFRRVKLSSFNGGIKGKQNKVFHHRHRLALHVNLLFRMLLYFK